MAGHVPGTGWHGLRTEGSENNFSPGSPYEIEVHLRGQRVRLFVNSVRVLEGNLPHPMSDDQIGLFAFGDAPVQFSKFSAEPDKPQAFVVTQYGEPYETLYNDVIKPVSVDMDFFPYRAKDVYHPGLILKDIIHGLVESEVIIAEITPANPNVFTNWATPMRWGSRRFSWRYGEATYLSTFTAIAASSTTTRSAGRRKSRPT